jgi:trans-feruloyl-CoA hydratase/vanillin synthase
MLATLEMEMNYRTVKVETAGKVAKVILNRPDKKNAMNPQLHEDMSKALEDLRYNDDIAVVVITGAGNAFCAGMDLKEFFHALKGKNRHEYDRIFRISTEWRGRTLRYYPKPTIAMVNGYCFGGAFSIVEGCDLAIAADEATFGLSEINFRMFPGGSVSKSLANILHSRDALLFAMTGRTFDGKKAAEMKFVNFSVPLANLESEAMALANEIAAKDADGLRGCKDAYRFSLEMSWEASMNYTAAKEEEVLNAQGGAWMKSGIGDFVEGKYKPGLEGHEGVQAQRSKR